MSSFDINDMSGMKELKYRRRHFTGWDNSSLDHVQKVISVKVNHRVSEYEHSSVKNIDERTKYYLANDLAKNLVNQGYVNFMKSLIQEDFIYTAQINIAGEKFSSCIVNKDSFYVKGQEFNKTEIEESIRNTFPERFI